MFFWWYLDFAQIGSLARTLPNKGSYYFNPKTLTKTDMMYDAWKKFNFGVLQVRLTTNWMAAKGDG